MIVRWWSNSTGVIALLWTGLLGGCKGGLQDPGKGQHWHPDPARLPSPEAFDWVITAQDSTDPVLHTWAARLRQAQLRWERGAWLSEDRYSMFGRVWDVVVDGEGRVVVLDFENQEIRVYDQRGSFETLVGHQGEGPGEYIQAGRLLIGENDSLYVYDYSRSLFVIYRRHESGYTFERILDLPDGASSLDYACLHSEGYIVTQKSSRLREDPLFYKIDFSSSVIESFGTHRHYHTEEDEGFLHDQINRAYVLCGQGVVAVYLFYPIVDYFSGNRRYSFFLKEVNLQPFLLIDNRIAEYLNTDRFIEKTSYTGWVDQLEEPVLLKEDLLFYNFVRYEARNGEIINRYPMAYLLDLPRRKALLLNLEAYPFAALAAVRDSVLVGFRWDFYREEIPHIAYYVLPSQSSGKEAYESPDNRAYPGSMANGMPANRVSR